MGQELAVESLRGHEANAVLVAREPAPHFVADELRRITIILKDLLRGYG